jgi:hypothetical protein
MDQLAVERAAVLVIVLEVAQGMIQSGRYSPSAEKFVETCLPSIKSEKADDVGVAEYEPMVQVINASLKETVGLLVGIMGATCERPVMEPVNDAYPDLVTVTVTVTD